jgi:hypothetical protein
MQFDLFLQRLEAKLETHIRILNGRNLSITGRAHLANSLLLSRLWHVLRVLVAPQKWLKKCESLICKFICPYHPAPSWTTICKPKESGGAVMINISQQALSLHLTFLQNTLQDVKWNFTSSLIPSLLRAHTGQPSLLSVLLFPRQMERLLQAVAQMARNSANSSQSYQRCRFLPHGQHICF